MLPTLRLSGWRADLLFWTGLSALVASILLLAGNAGALVVIPVAATMAIIVACNEGLPSSARLLTSWRPVQWTGDNSYALYLWHWPVLVFAPFVTGVPSESWFMVLLLGFVVVLAWATTRFVENPVRRTPLEGAQFHRRRKVAALAVTGGLVVTLAVAGASLWVSAKDPEITDACIDRGNTVIDLDKVSSLSPGLQTAWASQ